MDRQWERSQFCPEVMAKTSRLGLTILEVPINYDARNVGASNKIHWTDGQAGLAT